MAAITMLLFTILLFTKLFTIFIYGVLFTISYLKTKAINAIAADII
jgi:hypothetical protein